MKVYCVLLPHHTLLLKEQQKQIEREGLICVCLLIGLQLPWQDLALPGDLKIVDYKMKKWWGIYISIQLKLKDGVFGKVKLSCCPKKRSRKHKEIMQSKRLGPI